MDVAGWDARYAARDLIWGAAARFVARELADVPAGRALDLGAGEGRNAVWLAGRGWQVTAVDFSPVAVNRGRQLGAALGVAVHWRVADLRAYRPQLQAFDAVLVAYLHLAADDLTTMLARAAAGVAAGGRIVVVGHDLSNLDRGTGGPQDPGLLYTPEATAALLPGLTVLRAGTVTRTVATGSGTVEAIDTLVVATRSAAA